MSVADEKLFVRIGSAAVTIEQVNSVARGAARVELDPSPAFRKAGSLRETTNVYNMMQSYT